MQVTQLFTYPVKSMGSVETSLLHFSNGTLEGDRIWMVIDEETGEMITARDRNCGKMLLIKPIIGNDSLQLNFPDGGSVEVEIIKDKGRSNTREVSVWEQSSHKAYDEGGMIAEVISDYLGRSCRLVCRSRSMKRKKYGSVLSSFSDGTQLLVVGENSVEDLNERLQKLSNEPATVNHFRPNIVVGNCAPFDEDFWQEVLMGEQKLIGKHLCYRCPMVNIDPENAEKNPEVLRTLNSYRRNIKNEGEDKIHFGRGFQGPRDGVIRIGDQVQVLVRG